MKETLSSYLDKPSQCCTNYLSNCVSNVQMSYEHVVSSPSKSFSNCLIKRLSNCFSKRLSKHLIALVNALVIALANALANLLVFVIALVM